LLRKIGYLIFFAEVSDLKGRDFRSWMSKCVNFAEFIFAVCILINFFFQESRERKSKLLNDLKFENFAEPIFAVKQ